MSKNTELGKMVDVEPLAVKYRPRCIDDIVGNEESVNVIKGMFKSRRVIKTFLFSGPTGAGKTTAARMLAMTLNCQNLPEDNKPCLVCDSCKAALNNSHPDIHELNCGGEEGKVEAIRKVIEYTKFKPRYNFRVIIADEAQGLTGKTKQEMLKPIEEPGKGVIWILCTMEPEKLDKAIYGRCIRLFFHYPSVEVIAKRVYKICRREFPENITTLLKPYIKGICDGCGCQPRDSIATLEKIANSLLGMNIKKLSEKEIKKIVTGYIQTSGDLDTQVMQFLSFSFCGKRLKPLEILRSIEGIRMEEFITLCHRYSHYAALYILHTKMGTKIDRIGFWGMQFLKWDNILSELVKKYQVDDSIPMAMCTSATIAIEKIRRGIMPPSFSTLFMYQNFMEIYTVYRKLQN